jgi:hypothetical protein
VVLAGTISLGQRYQLAREVGFTPADAIVMAAISALECGNCELNSVNATGDLGLWQINSSHWAQYGGQAALVDPLNSARAAYGIWSAAGGGVGGFKQWCVYPGGCGGQPGSPNFLQELTLATVAAGGVDPQAPPIVDPNGSGGLGGGQVGGGPGPTAANVGDPCADQKGPFGLDGFAILMCRIGRTWQTVTSKGFWWAVLLFSLGAIAIVGGLLLVFRPRLPGVSVSV